MRAEDYSDVKAEAAGRFLSATIAITAKATIAFSGYRPGIILRNVSGSWGSPPGTGGYLGMFPPLLLESGEAQPNRERADHHHG
jgi:hypothetical protein